VGVRGGRGAWKQFFITMFLQRKKKTLKILEFCFMVGAVNLSRIFAAVLEA
jgi:hypothetical protein